MPVPKHTIGLTIAVAVGIVAAALPLGAWRWNRRTMAREAELQRRGQSVGHPVSLTTLPALPAPVERYFAFALKDRGPRVAQAMILHEGQFNTTGEPGGWRPFRSRELFVPGAPGFVWDARIELMPGLPIRVRDEYLGGIGSMRAEVGGWVPIARASGGGELARGSLMRYLGEAVWLPTALLPSQHLTWAGIDDSTAVATLRDGDVSASLDFHFGADGSILRVSASDRPREVDGEFEPTAWSVSLMEYADRNGMKIPLRAEARWELPERALPYWRGRVIGVDFGVEAR